MQELLCIVRSKCIRNVFECVIVSLSKVVPFSALLCRFQVVFLRICSSSHSTVSHIGIMNFVGLLQLMLSLTVCVRCLTELANKHIYIQVYCHKDVCLLRMFDRSVCDAHWGEVRNISSGKCGSGIRVLMNLQCG